MTRKVITPYFSHDANARNSDKLLAVRIKHGAEGYGIYFMILERLREESDYTSSINYDVMAYDFRVDSEKIRSIVEDFGLFEFNKDGSRFYSPDLNDRMEMKDKKVKDLSEKRRNAANKRWNKETNENEDIESENNTSLKDNDEKNENKDFNDDEALSSNFCTVINENLAQRETEEKFIEKNNDNLSNSKAGKNFKSLKSVNINENMQTNASAIQTNASAMQTYAKQSKEKQSKEKQRKQKQTKDVINTFDFHPKVFEYTSNPELRDCLCVFFDERAKSKSVDESVVDMFFKQLDSYSAGDEDKKILILRNSNLNGWKNIYPVNLNGKKSTSKLDEYYMTDSRQTDGYSEAELKDIFNLKSHL